MVYLIKGKKGVSKTIKVAGILIVMILIAIMFFAVYQSIINASIMADAVSTSGDVGTLMEVASVAPENFAVAYDAPMGLENFPAIGSLLFKVDSDTGKREVCTAEYSENEMWMEITNDALTAWGVSFAPISVKKSRELQRKYYEKWAVNKANELALAQNREYLLTNLDTPTLRPFKAGVESKKTAGTTAAMIKNSESVDNLNDFFKIAGDVDQAQVVKVADTIENKKMWINWESQLQGRGVRPDVAKRLAQGEKEGQLLTKLSDDAASLKFMKESKSYDAKVWGGMRDGLRGAAPSRLKVIGGGMKDANILKFAETTEGRQVLRMHEGKILPKPKPRKLYVRKGPKDLRITGKFYKDIYSDPAKLTKWQGYLERYGSDLDTLYSNKKIAELKAKGIRKPQIKVFKDAEKMTSAKFAARYGDDLNPQAFKFLSAEKDFAEFKYLYQQKNSQVAKLAKKGGIATKKTSELAFSRQVSNAWETGGETAAGSYYGLRGHHNLGVVKRYTSIGQRWRDWRALRASRQKAVTDAYLKYKAAKKTYKTAQATKKTEEASEAAWDAVAALENVHTAREAEKATLEAGKLNSFIGKIKAPGRALSARIGAKTAAYMAKPAAKLSTRVGQNAVRFGQGAKSAITKGSLAAALDVCGETPGPQAPFCKAGAYSIAAAFIAMDVMWVTIPQVNMILAGHQASENQKRKVACYEYIGTGKDMYVDPPSCAPSYGEVEIKEPEDWLGKVMGKLEWIFGGKTIPFPEATCTDNTVFSDKAKKQYSPSKTVPPGIKSRLLEDPETEAQIEGSCKDYSTCPNYFISVPTPPDFGPIKGEDIQTMQKAGQVTQLVGGSVACSALMAYKPSLGIFCFGAYYAKMFAEFRLNPAGSVVLYTGSNILPMNEYYYVEFPDHLEISNTYNYTTGERTFGVLSE